MKKPLPQSPAKRLWRRGRLPLISISALFMMGTTPTPGPDSGLGDAPAVSDAELSEMRGKFITADSIRYFGVTLHSLWETGDGVITAARLGFNIWLGEGGASGPQVVIQWERDGDSDMDVTGFGNGVAEQYVVAGIAGASQTNVIAGSDNQTANRMSVAIVPASALQVADNGGSFAGTQTNTAADGDTITFVSEPGQFGLSIVDAQGGGTVRQGISSGPGQLSQLIHLDSDRNHVTNNMNVTVGIDHGAIANSINITNSLSAMKGHGY